MLKRLAVITSVLLLVSGTVTPAIAQEKGDTGLTLGFPASVGLLWHVTENVAIRPEFNFSTTSNENSDVWTYGLGVSALFYVSNTDNVRTYFSPRFTYSQSNLGIDRPGGGDTDLNATSYGFIGSFGAQYTPNSRFGIFGEVGLGYSRATSEIEDFDEDSKSHNLSLRTGAGVIFYF
jgi:opacity protein-like surface antigen